jgi:hypothetical protein
MDEGGGVLDRVDGGGEVGFVLAVTMLTRPQWLLKGEMEAGRCAGLAYIALRRPE